MYLATDAVLHQLHRGMLLLENNVAFNHLGSNVDEMIWSLI